MSEHPPTKALSPAALQALIEGADGEDSFDHAPTRVHVRALARQRPGAGPPPDRRSQVPSARPTQVRQASPRRTSRPRLRLRHLLAAAAAMCAGSLAMGLAWSWAWTDVEQAGGPPAPVPPTTVASVKSPAVNGARRAPPEHVSAPDPNSEAVAKGASAAAEQITLEEVQGAVAALSAGDLEQAVDRYRALAQRSPAEVYGGIVRVLERRLECRASDAGGRPCDG